MSPEKTRLYKALGLGVVWSEKPSAAHEVHEPLPPMDLEQLRQQVSACKRCTLCESRTQTVFSAGTANADLMVIGEAPGADEDRLGEPFVGAAGQLLDRLLHAMGRSRQSNVYIANVLKCRPPGNRNPQVQEVAQCTPYLVEQVQAVNPKALLLVGRFAIDAVLNTSDAVGTLRGKVHTVRVGAWEGPVVVSYHPAYLLRNLPEKSKVWKDLLLLDSVLSAGR